jgi:hypothetical protein
LCPTTSSTPRSIRGAAKSWSAVGRHRQTLIQTDSVTGISALGMRALELHYDSEESKEGVCAFN